MRKCPACQAAYDVTDALCPQCGVELPAPYEGWDDEEDDDVEDEVVAIVGEDVSADVFAALGVSPVAPDMRNLAPEEITILAGATLYVDGDVFDTSTVVVAGGRIVEVTDRFTPDPHTGSPYYNLKGRILTPGFIDVHVHGMMGIDTNLAAADDFMRVAADAAARGTTTLLPTTVACPPEELRRVLSSIKEARSRGVGGARLLGTHLESNFISMDYKGAQPPDWIFPYTDPRAAEIMAVLEEYADQVRIMTIAPELDGALELQAWLLEHGIIVSLGHSGANYDQATAAIDAGATHVTHLFNAMPPLHHRNPGLVGAALERDEVFTEMVCDGIHIHPAVISAAISAKGAERFMPISDGLQGAGMGEGEEFFLGGQHVTVREGVARLDSGTIAGSITTMDRIVRLLVERVGWDLGEALMMVSTTPADALQLPVLGRIAQGAVADLTVLNQDLEVMMTFVGGQVMFTR